MRTQEAVVHFGTQAALAKAIGLAQPTIAGWKEYPPLERQIDIEVATNGVLKAELTVEQRAVLANRRRRQPGPTATNTEPQTPPLSTERVA